MNCDEKKKKNKEEEEMVCERFVCGGRRRMSIDTYSYKKINHKKYVECEINLLRDVIAEFHAHFNIFVVRVHEVDDERRNAEYEYEHHLKENRRIT